MSVDIYSKIEYDVMGKGIFMKKIVATCVLFSLLLCSCKGDQKPKVVIVDTSSTYEQENLYLVSYSSTLVENDSVGSDWITGVKREGREQISNREFVFDGEQIELLLYAIEKDDKCDDVGEKTITFSKLSTGEEKTVTELVEVEENGGAYTGSVAKWEFTVTLKRLS